jgi:hypothetical protein
MKNTYFPGCFIAKISGTPKESKNALHTIDKNCFTEAKRRKLLELFWGKFQQKLLKQSMIFQAKFSPRKAWYCHPTNNVV